MRRYLLPLAVVGLVAALAPAAATATAAKDHAAPARPKAARPAAARVVRLPTGDTVRIGRVAGRQQVDVVAAHRTGITGQFETGSLGGDSYVFPAEARAFLGRLLDPSLFDVTALARLEQAGRIPVTLSCPRAAHLHVPGLTLTSRSARTARGYLAARGAAAFRTALAAAWRVTARPGGTTPHALFGGVTHLGVTGASAPPTPKFQQYTLKIKVLNAAGRPAAGGIVGIINTDDGRKYGAFVFYQHGGARVSVPAGHYSGVTDVATFRHGITDRIIPVADFTVTGNDQTVTFDARAATARVAVHTPRRAAVSTLSVEFDREARGVGSLGSSFAFGRGTTVLVAPTRSARFGAMQWLTTWELVGTAKKARPYTYDLSFLDDGRVSPHQSHSVASFQLATVQSAYYSDRSRGADSAFVRTPIYPFQFIVFGFFLPLHTPVRRAEYVYAGASAVWQDQLIAVATGRNPFGGLMLDDSRHYSPGERRSAQWLRGPLAPGTQAQTNGDSFFTCPACRTIGKLQLVLAPTTDTTPGHFGFVSDGRHGTPGTHFALYRGRKVIAHGADGIGALVSVPALTGRYRVHMTTNRQGDAARTSTATSTDLVFRSAAGTGARLPDGWNCGIPHPKICTVLPLLHAHVPLPTTLTGRLPVGKTTFVLTIAPVQGAKATRITHAQFETRVAGKRFRAATMHRLGNGRYRVTLVNPRSAAGHPVTIRVFAADSAGGSITQTTRAAYVIARP